MKYRLPSVKTLAQVFEEPIKARKILELSPWDLEDLPTVAAHMRQCYHHPGVGYLRMLALNALDSGLHGVELFRSSAGVGWYLNVGDIYSPTLILWQGHYRVQDVGTLIERQERRGVQFE